MLVTIAIRSLSLSASAMLARRGAAERNALHLAFNCPAIAFDMSRTMSQEIAEVMILVMTYSMNSGLDL
jgi:hypothetical protein